MIKAPDFLTAGFQMSAASWCENCSQIRLHILEYVAKTDMHVSYYKTCKTCIKLKNLGVELGDIRKADVIVLQEYIWLVMNPEDVLS